MESGKAGKYITSKANLKNILWSVLLGKNILWMFLSEKLNSEVYDLYVSVSNVLSSYL